MMMACLLIVMWQVKKEKENFNLNIQTQKKIEEKLVRSESLKWCHKLRRSHSKMELQNIYSHKMAINTHYIHERTFV